jgi:putative endonuclease
MSYFLYILRSKKDGGHYVGITGDVNKRLKYHNNGYVRSTKSRTPFILIYVEEYQEMSQARNREKFLKSYSGAGEKISIIKNLALSSNG